MTYAQIRKAAVGVAVVTALGTIAACGPSGGGKATHDDHGTTADNGSGTGVTGALTALRTAATKTDQANSAKVDGTTVFGQVSMTMNGELAWQHGMTGDVDIKMSGGQAATAMKQLGGDGSYRVRYLTDAMYVDMGQAISGADGGKPWLKYDYAVLSKLMGASGNALQDELQNNNPTRSVQMLIGSGDVKSVGSETVRGVSATHYTGTVAVSKIVASQSGLDAATAKEIQSQLKAQGMTTDHVDVWVDGHGLLVKKVERATMNSGPFTSTSYYSDYGTKVDVAPPPAAQTMDISQLVEQSQGKTS